MWLVEQQSINVTLRAHWDKLFIQCIGSTVSGKIFFSKGNKKTHILVFVFWRPGQLKVWKGLYSVLSSWCSPLPAHSVPSLVCQSEWYSIRGLSWPCRVGLHAATLTGRQLLNGMVFVVVVQKRDILLIRGGPAAGVVADFFTLKSLLHGGQGDVVVASAGRALAAAVSEEDGLVSLVAKLQLAHGDLQVQQWARCRHLPGALSPFALAGVPPGLSFHQCPDNLLEFSLCEALEHVHDCKKNERGTTIS